MRRGTVAAVGAAAAGLLGVVVKRALDRERHRVTGEVGVRRYADALAYEEVLPGVAKALLRGDPGHGPYAAFTRFAPGVELPLHAHPHDVTLVVLRGAYHYGTAEGEVRVNAGSYFVVPGDVPHTSGCDPIDGCLLYEESAGRFAQTPWPARARYMRGGGGADATL